MFHLPRHATTARSARAARRTARAAEARLRTEVRSYSTDAERNELLEIIDRHPEASGAALRRMLA